MTSTATDEKNSIPSAVSIPNDVESRRRPEWFQEKPGNETSINSSLLVTWDGEDDPANPKNWPLRRKWTITILTSFGGLICLMSSTMLAPALENIAHDLHIAQDKANMTLSIFVLAFAFGPMVLAPVRHLCQILMSIQKVLTYLLQMAEVFGRRNVWLFTSTWYTVWNMACGLSHGNGLLLAGRLLAGLGSSAEFAVRLALHFDAFSDAAEY